MKTNQKTLGDATPAQKGGVPGLAYLHPYACFQCRKSFKRASKSAPVLPCPHCGGPSIGLTRKFKPPKQSDSKQWAKVEALVRHGFLFWSLGERYPDTLQEVDAFARKHAQFLRDERERALEAYAQIDAALAAVPVRTG
ncbi:hypothetical protein [Sinorhizobium arboris]|uniref:hypothetical protein n=1 Tax=Sinorhizobium arboris TaxID=76745 RepID=UPI0012432C8B|nr:hypothetical protein [Sinorhizobium arboris]